VNVTAARPVVRSLKAALDPRDHGDGYENPAGIDGSEHSQARRRPLSPSSRASAPKCAVLHADEWPNRLPTSLAFAEGPAAASIFWRYANKDAVKARSWCRARMDDSYWQRIGERRALRSVFGGDRSCE